MAQPLPGKGLLGWLGRQVGYVRRAARSSPSAAKIVYRDGKIEEADHPTEPGMKLRRTVIDEVIVELDRPGVPKKS